MKSPKITIAALAIGVTAFLAPMTARDANAGEKYCCTCCFDSLDKAVPVVIDVEGKKGKKKKVSTGEYTCLYKGQSKCKSYQIYPVAGEDPDERCASKCATAAAQNGLGAGSCPRKKVVSTTARPGACPKDLASGTLFGEGEGEGEGDSDDGLNFNLFDTVSEFGL